MIAEMYKSFSDLKTYRKGEYVYNNNSFDGFTYYLADGLVGLSVISVEGMEKILLVIRPGNIFGENSFGEKPHYYSAKAQTDCLIWRFNKENWLEAVQKDPRLALSTVNSLSKRIRYLNNQALQLTFSDATARLAYTLYSSFKQSNVKTKNGYPCVNVPQEELAKMAGLNRVTIARLINFFKKEGIVEAKGRWLTLINLQKLKDIIVDNP